MFTLQFLQTIFPTYEGKLSNKQIQINEVTTDSRKKTTNSLFIPIIGDTFDGHDFIHQAIAQGAVAALWNRKVTIPDDIPETFIFFFVDDTVQALQAVAKAYLKKIDPIVIGITGSNGKTTTKDLIKAVLATKRKTHATKGNFNNHIGLPLTILQMETDTEIAVLEMGMNDFHEIESLTNIAQPDYAIITNIGESHIEHLGSREGIAKAKLEIRSGIQADGLLFIDGDEKLFDHLSKEPYVRTCGFQLANDAIITNIHLHEQKTTFKLNKEKYTIPLLGKHHAKNATFAILIAKELGYQYDEIQTGLMQLEHSQMRFEWILGKNNVSIINDAYNASPTSMRAAINVVKQIQGYKRKVVVLGDILELGSYSKSFHYSIAEEIDLPIQVVFTYGDHAEEIAKYVQKNKQAIHCEHFTSKEQVIESLNCYLEEETLLLFKASRGMKLEEIIEEIME